MTYPLPSSTPAQLGLDPAALERLMQLVTRHVAERRYPGAQLAIARHGKLALARTLGAARLDPGRVAATDDTLWLLYSNTKVLTACAVWLLADRGALSFTDTVAAHVPGFEAHGKGEITIIQLLTHQAGFPSAEVPSQVWDDHELLCRTVCEFPLEWAPGSKVHYHRLAAHWTAAVLIEALTKTDYRTFIREQVIVPLGLGDDLFVGLPDTEAERAADMHEPGPDGRPAKRAEENHAAFRRAGTPGRRAATARRAGWSPSTRCCSPGARSGLAGSSRRARSRTCCATTRATDPTATWGCRCTAASARTCAARPTPSAASARWPRRALSATAASAPRIAGRTPTPAYRSRT